VTGVEWERFGPRVGLIDKRTLQLLLAGSKVSHNLKTASLMDWPDEPASEQQVVRLKSLGCVPTAHLTMTEAARLIRQYQKSLRQTGSIPSLKPSASNAPANPAVSATLSESARNMAHRLHETAANAKHAMAVAPGAANVRADVVAAIAARVEFWLDTCREVREMQIATVQVYELHHDYGHRLFAPTREQVQEVLDALDVGIPLWDKEHPDLFYKTLELNFPNLVRKP